MSSSNNNKHSKVMTGIASAPWRFAGTLGPRRQQQPSQSSVGRSLALWTVVTALLLCGQNVRHALLQQSSSALRRNPEAPRVVQTTTASTPTIAWAVTVTGCSKYPLDGAAVLQHSVQKLTTRSRYLSQFYAIYHPSAAACVQPLAALGYTLLERETPVNVSEIEGAFYRDMMPKSGCCGEKELLKFEALRLTQHPIVVMLDMDMIVSNPLDDLFDLMLYNRHPLVNHHFMRPDQELPRDIWLFYTNDYTITSPDVDVKPTQGGFTIVKPNVTIYNDIMSIVKKGNFSGRYGWHPRSDFFYGSPTFQGLTPYYYQIVQPGHAVELNWCRHNSGNTPPRTAQGKCFTNQTNCEDCRDMKLSDVYVYHFLFCGKPWMCDPDEERKLPKHFLCHESHRQWFELRDEMMASWGRHPKNNDTVAIAQSSNDPPPKEAHLGFCHPGGVWGKYQPIRQPFGAP